MGKVEYLTTRSPLYLGWWHWRGEHCFPPTAVWFLTVTCTDPRSAQSKPLCVSHSKQPRDTGMTEGTTQRALSCVCQMRRVEGEISVWCSCKMAFPLNFRPETGYARNFLLTYATHPPKGATVAVTNWLWFEFSFLYRTPMRKRKHCLLCLITKANQSPWNDVLHCTRKLLEKSIVYLAMFSAYFIA